MQSRFDARQQWPKCKSIGYIRDQSKCNSSWAISAASAMGDRLCIIANGSINVHISDTDIFTCCGEKCGDGCNGGNPIEAWNFVIEHGAVTGGRYFEIETCRPYPFHPCGKVGQIDYGQCPEEGYETPKCRKSCVQNYLVDYLKDKHHGLSAYTVDKDEKEIRREIMANGPVQATFLVYSDFKNYTSGIYRHVRGELEGSQSVKIIGWGSEDGTDFWLLANSRGETWGEKGYFRMVRGGNACGLEEHVVAGQMKD
ncbi:unnamed protein product [Cylicocyclus nassatus]|uniref:Peptidase C1A papain C-terminal domain-containing protein n=1 Tax=Cylicocyclus nassatus TaxID=53992 RepID=A0AA36GQF1_CYLNA|nr:unnamed protein product [Cylicocyclus nassatus]